VLQIASNGAIDPGIIVPAQTGELSPSPSSPSPSPGSPVSPAPFQKPFPFNVSIPDLVKNILNVPAHNQTGFLFEAKSANGKDEQVSTATIQSCDR